LKQRKSQKRFNRIVVGVITNSDDRIPSIISSFGVNISPLRYGTELDSNAAAEDDYEIDFHCMSYDVGAEKPDGAIFRAAEKMLVQIVAIRSGKASTDAETDVLKWQKLYVGDEYAKDVVGASNAGWNPVLLDRDETSDLPKLEHDAAETIDDVFNQHSAVRVSSVQQLVAWLAGGN
jgi:hypothetical protein